MTLSAADALARLYEQRLAASKDAYGTTGGYVTDRTATINEARAAIARTNAQITAAQASSTAASDPALATTNAPLDEIADQNTRLISEQQRTNDFLAKIAGAGGATTDFSFFATSEGLIMADNDIQIVLMTIDGPSFSMHSSKVGGDIAKLTNDPAATPVVATKLACEATAYRAKLAAAGQTISLPAAVRAIHQAAPDAALSNPALLAQNAKTYRAKLATEGTKIDFATAVRAVAARAI